MRSDQQSLDVFRVYLDQIGQHPLLTREDEVELSQAYEAGLDAQLKLADTAADDPARPELEAVADRGEWARRKMIESNLRLVVSIARRFSATGLPLGDLVQEGNLGLLRAVEKFDWRKGFKFSTYATWWIRQAIARGAADRGVRIIRLPVHVDEQLGRLWRTHTRMLELLGREPSDEELAVELDMPAGKVARLRDAAQTVTSLDAPVGEDGAALGDFLEDDSVVGPDELAVEVVGREALDDVLAALPHRERQVLILWSATPWPPSAAPRPGPASTTLTEPPELVGHRSAHAASLGAAYSPGGTGRWTGSGRAAGRPCRRRPPAPGEAPGPGWGRAPHGCSVARRPPACSQAQAGP
jgi:RNA polymerase sigma factor (sigma-70 family)